MQAYVMNRDVIWGAHPELDREAAGRQMLACSASWYRQQQLLGLCEHMTGTCQHQLA